MKRPRLFLFYLLMALTSLFSPSLGMQMITDAERGAKEKK